MTTHLKACAKSFTVWLNTMLLLAFPFTDQIMGVINANLPALAPYLPPNVYKYVGYVVVVFNLVRAMKQARAAAAAKAVSNG